MPKIDIKKYKEILKTRLQNISLPSFDKSAWQKRMSKIFVFLCSWWQLLLLGFVLFIFLYYPLGGFIVNNIDRNTSYEINLSNAKQSSTAEMAAFIINREVNDKLWTANLPFFFPSYFLDNMPNFQLGMMKATSNVVTSLSKRVDSPIMDTQDVSDLQNAAQLLKYNGRIWMFSPTDRLTPVPSANTQYRKARKHLISYNRSLNKDEQIFYRRSEDLVYILKKIDKSLSAAVTALDNQIREENTSFTDFKADDVFYYNQGKAYGYFLLLKALGQDYKEILVQKDVYVLWTRMIKSLEDASSLDIFYIRNPELNSLTAANHLLYLAYYIEKARNAEKDIIVKLEEK